jgi:hypothetical protein
MLSLEYINFLESLPCNRHARRRSRPVGQWLEGWVPGKQVMNKNYPDSKWPLKGEGQELL